MLDAIDPQDMDFDLDKSSSFHALPGGVLADVYYWAGYNEPAQSRIPAIWRDVQLTRSADI